MTYYFVGDVPPSALVLVPTRAGDDGQAVPIELELWQSCAAQLVTPGGGAIPVDATIADDGTIAVDLGPDPFPEGGLYLLRLTLERAAADATEATPAIAAARQRIDAVPIVVQADDGWHTLPSARAEWKDAGRISDRRLWVLLDIARTQVSDYAPQLLEGQLPPIAYREAQLMQARNLWNASRVDPSGSSGEDSFAVTPFPLDWTIKQLLRPKRARPVVA